MRTFVLYRKEDETGVSGTGIVAEGVIFKNGKCSVSWLTDVTSVGCYSSIEDVEKIHCHNEKTHIVYFDSTDSYGNEMKEIISVSELGDKIGFGRMMQLAQELWKESLISKYGFSGGEHVCGPCAAMVVPCECLRPSKCDWCCGSTWLTKHVKEIKDSYLKKGDLKDE